MSWESVNCGRVACERGAWLGLESSVYIRTTPMFMFGSDLRGTRYTMLVERGLAKGARGMESSQVKNVKSLQYINLRVDFCCS